jgi:hypothetical protein
VISVWRAAWGVVSGAGWIPPGQIRQCMRRQEVLASDQAVPRGLEAEPRRLSFHLRHKGLEQALPLPRRQRCRTPPGPWLEATARRPPASPRVTPPLADSAQASAPTDSQAVAPGDSSAAAVRKRKKAAADASSDAGETPAGEQKGKRKAAPKAAAGSQPRQQPSGDRGDQMDDDSDDDDVPLSALGAGGERSKAQKAPRPAQKKPKQARPVDNEMDAMTDDEAAMAAAAAPAAPVSAAAPAATPAAQAATDSSQPTPASRSSATPSPRADDAAPPRKGDKPKAKSVSMVALPYWITHGGPITSIHAMADDVRLLTSSLDMSVKVWNIAPALTLKGEDDASIPVILSKLDHETAINCARGSPDCKTIATACDGGFVCIWVKTREDADARPLPLAQSSGEATLNGGGAAAAVVAGRPGSVASILRRPGPASPSSKCTRVRRKAQQPTNIEKVSTGCASAPLTSLPLIFLPPCSRGDGNLLVGRQPAFRDVLCRQHGDSLEGV